jgi:hypothetical protein
MRALTLSAAALVVAAAAPLQVRAQSATPAGKIPIWTCPPGTQSTGSGGCVSLQPPPPEKHFELPPPPPPAYVPPPETDAQRAARLAADRRVRINSCVQDFTPLESDSCAEVRADPALAAQARQAAQRHAAERAEQARKAEAQRLAEKALGDKVIASLTACQTQLPDAQQPRGADGSIVHVAISPRHYRLGFAQDVNKFVLDFAGGDYAKLQNDFDVIQPSSFRAGSADIIGVALFYGCGVERNPRAAAYYWQVSATDGGNYTSAYNIGVGYEHGVGVRKDMGRARFWYSVGAMHGEPNSLAAAQRLHIPESEWRNVHENNKYDNVDWDAKALRQVKAPGR